jgi:hypothetical protein
VVEASLAHGSFDTRRPSARQDSSCVVPTVPPLRTTDAAERLDWNAYSSRYFPGRKRHDMERHTGATRRDVKGGSRKKRERDACWPRFAADRR